ncbi:hypothetical protein [Candidatus Enterococcus murrayae]|uniref:Bacterial archaeo-eukaryotic release factor family 6 domain-containing protein n=1 Tax=Candidatus Enterococcus murrayae TaxID=2815321 RepID=A0ABS3HDP4_9ENTE|nr:hypothetical protein [Enterococcus sp. MJM16]MBO0451035.1 hypothetical protein [Enterococcus sp. MJM16]
MANISKKLLTELTSEEATGPFITFMLNTHHAHQDVEKDQIMFKNFAKEAKKRFEKKYTDHSFEPFQEKIDQLLADGDFWRSGTKSVAVILTTDETYIHRLNISVDDQYYVSELPYLLAIIKNAQFNYAYYLMTLNRDSMKLYFVRNKEVKMVELPDDAPMDIVTALGDELTGGDLNVSARGGEVGSYHGVNAKDEEVEIDWVNYYQAVDNFIKELDNPDQLPLYLFALPENQTQFKKIAKNPYYSDKAAINGSPAQANINEIKQESEKLSDQLADIETQTYQKLINRKFVDQLVDIVPAAKEGKISHLFIATSNLVDGFGEDPDVEYDRRQVLNEIADNVIKNGGQVFVLDQKDAPDEKSLLAILRY